MLFRKTILLNHARAALAALVEDLATGGGGAGAMRLGRRARESLQIASQFTSGGGYRGSDILHLATAPEVGAKEFLSCDAQQKKL